MLVFIEEIEKSFHLHADKFTFMCSSNLHYTALVTKILKFWYIIGIIDLDFNYFKELTALNQYFCSCPSVAPWEQNFFDMKTIPAQWFLTVC